ncbi:ZYRO0D08668p [Zygosaccharomyces rouxii]|uniref:ZYRO0D08668p n=2 Tax=Zygosaccharomyces rouxii TaxID=4956 RepID=C5DVQ8_ZYGRC|nr:uncharacterized protein ZYRO0D08668g [Zygosaccharomyces rouxii]KAH9200789.1 hypothetical protein LQ764DRAFT_99339 [Zygosaccharomyces rouxii]CAQ43580.1 Uncharacterized protein YNR021W [Zygosaccharomyces rouxii]CAR27877.1 ZYRO0D08668p [Zygosaccharomyces rouxii]
MSGLLAPVLKLSELVNSFNDEYVSTPYEELKQMTILQRLSRYNWTFEIGGILVIAIVFALYKLGLYYNTRMTDGLFTQLNDYFKNDQQFARVGFANKDGSKLQYLDEQQKTWFTTFATGRSAVESICVRAHLYGRSNPAAMLMERLLGTFFPSMTVKDLDEYCEIVVKPNGIYVANETAKPNANVSDILNNFKFVTSVVHKSSMNEVRRDNYYLSLTRTTESAKLPVEYVYMSEMNQLNEFISHYAPNFFQVLREASSILHCISFTDLPTEKPLTEKKWNANLLPRAVIRTSIPSNKAQFKALKDVIGSVIAVYDNFTKDLVQKNPHVFITNDLLKKTSQLRSQELAKIVKTMKQVEREMALEKKHEAEKEQRRLLKQSGDAEKFDQKKRDRRERRAKNKQKVRM